MRKDGVDRVKNVLKELPFFEDFTDDDFDYFSRHTSIRFFNKDTELFKAGDRGDYLFFVVESNVEIRLETIGTRLVVASCGWGNCVGEMSVIDEHPRSASVIVTEPSELLILTKNRFDALSQENPLLGFKFLRGIAKNLSLRLRRMTGRFADLA
ncbi:cyclic nucleotide-binding protein [Candidatus Magnetoovum chiemensis]|nr:cyclic nucleotide-binding protein [Candidatus Magnetoovum chiemensis]